MFSFKTTTAILCFPFAFALGLQADSCQRRSSPAPKASPSTQAKSTPPSQAKSTPSPQVKSTPRTNDVENAKARGGDVVKTLETGEWGGQHISLTVTEKGAAIEYDCGQGTIDGRVELSPDGRFDVRGTHENETGGPPGEISIVNDGDKAGPPDTGAKNRHPARYTGRVEGRTMSLTVTLTDDGSIVGKFVLNRGAAAHLSKCRG